MGNAYLGGQLRRLRENHAMTQAALARAVGISPSYLNQMERNQRPLTMRVLSRLDALFGSEARPLHDQGGDGRLVARVRAALADLDGPVSLRELHELADNSPTIARNIVELRRRLRLATERASLLAEQVSGQPGQPVAPTAFEAVRDYFYTHRNHIDDLDRAAEPLGEALPVRHRDERLAARLAERHKVKLQTGTDSNVLRRYDPRTATLHLSPHLSSGQRAFQIGTQLALLEASDIIEALCAGSGLSDGDLPLLRIGLANYYAGALIMPYRRFLAAAEETRYDIELLAQYFGVGFETACHRLSTLQRQGEEGVPFFFIRVDRAGNISKRQSATDFHFSRFGGSCPLWTIYDAFSRPAEVLTQLAEMPDGRRYMWIARTVTHGKPGFGAAAKHFAIALGCDVVHAERLVYAKALDLRTPEAATPIGPGCRLCDRPACPQRAFPMVGQPLAAQPSRSDFAPYSSPAPAGAGS